MKHYDVIILGGGAGGLMCAAQLRQNSLLSVAIIEGNNRPALKLKASGGGKCNLTNVEVDESHYLGDRALIKSVLSVFPQKALLEYFKDGGLRPVIRKERYYFCPKSSDEVISILLGKASGSDLLLGHKILSVEGQSPFVIITDKGKISAKNVVVATGGASYKELGASDIGLKIAQNYGIKTVPFSPALVGLTLQPKEFWMKELSGISCRARIHVAGKTLDEDLLFAHKGISGLVVLSASLYWHRGEIVIDFLPDFDLGRVKNEKKSISTAIPLPKRF
ncbi:MAG: aminoacetone oxidase family FAD-binding enzyme, partial [Sulfuricurvum sp.]|nr:aminoacetone oxidase family FAD-binding enzyme [Sulfuricurvum sp.]